MPRSYIDVENTGDSIPGWEHGQYRRFPRDVAGTCDQDDAIFIALSQATKVVQTSADIPVNLAGKVWAIRDCGSATGDTYADATNDGYTPPANPTNPTSPTTPNGNDATFVGLLVAGAQTNTGVLSAGATDISIPNRTFKTANTASPGVSGGLSALGMVNGAGWANSMVGSQIMGWPVLMHQWITDPNLPDYNRRGSHANGQSLLVVN